MSENINRYLKELEKYPPISREKEVELIKKAQKGDKGAFDQVIQSNLRFVVKVAKTYQQDGLEFDDLISEGNYGMVKALHRFDLSRNVKFISYAI